MSGPEQAVERPSVATLQARYAAALHAVQSATKFLIQRAQWNGDESLAGANPKHLRAGLNLVMTDTATLAQLLVRKGIISELEYFEAIVTGTERELERLTADARREPGFGGISFG